MPRKSAAASARDYLLPAEVEKLLKAATQDSRYAHRNFTLIFLCYRHGMKLGELTQLRWSMVDLSKRTLRLPRRSKNGPALHPLRNDEVKALRQLKKESTHKSFVFMSRLGSQLTDRSISRIVTEAGMAAGLKTHVAPSTLRRSCGRTLVLAGHNPVAVQQFLRYDDVDRVLCYLEVPKNPFRDFWKDESRG